MLLLRFPLLFLKVEAEGADDLDLVDRNRSPRLLLLPSGEGDVSLLFILKLVSKSSVEVVPSKQMMLAAASLPPLLPPSAPDSARHSVEASTRALASERPRIDSWSRLSELWISDIHGLL